MDFLKIQKISEKAKSVQGMIELLKSGQSVSVKVDDGCTFYSIVLVVSPDKKADYSASEAVSEILIAYLDSLTKELLHEVRG